MKNYSIVVLAISICTIGATNESFKANSSGYKTGKVKSYINRDTTTKVAIYADSALYSGFFNNFEIVLTQLLDRKRIDSLLKKPSPICYKLTEKDRKNYILNIDPHSIKTPVDTVIRGKRYQFTSLPLKLTNHSAYTLKYIIMDCSWLDSYFTNNKNVQFDKQICFKNVPNVNEILPKQTITVYFPILLSQKEKNTDQKFRIGMSLQKFIDRKQLYDFPFEYYLRPETSNLIWSNEVEIKAHN